MPGSGGIFVAIEIANHSTLLSFRNSLDSVAGKATIQIDGGEIGVPERTMTDLLKVPGITHAAPVVEAYPLARGKDREILMVQGIDLLREEGLRDYTLEGGKRWDFSEWEGLIEPDAVALCSSYMGNKIMLIRD